MCCFNEGGRCRRLPEIAASLKSVKILFLRFSSIGDIVLTTPLYRCVRQQLPDAEIHVLTKEAFRPVLSANPNIDRIHTFEKEVKEILPALVEEKYDYVADLHHNLRSLQVKRALNVSKTYSFPKLNIEKWLLTNLRINLLPDKSIVERYFETLKPLGIRNDGQGLDYVIPEKEKTRQDDLPFGHWAGFVGCVIGGSYETKKFPAHQWMALCHLLPYPVVLLGGKEDRELAEIITATHPGKIYNACGKFSLNESADLVRRSRVVVTNDTGLMHIAAAFRKPIISLWGNTAPEFGMFPYYGFNNHQERVAPQSVIVERKDLSCHPCSKIGYSHCPKGHFKCMNSLDVAGIAQAVAEKWSL